MISLKKKLIRTYSIFSIISFVIFVILGNQYVGAQFKAYAIERRNTQTMEVITSIKERIIANTLTIDYLDGLGDLLLQEGVLLMYENSAHEFYYCVTCTREDCLLTLEEMNQYMSTYFPTMDTSYHETRMDLIVEGVSYGTLILGHTNDFILTKIDFNYLLVLNLLFFILGSIIFIGNSLIGLVLSKNMNQPLEQLVAQLKKIPASQPLEKVETTITEIADLQDNINGLYQTLSLQKEFKKRVTKDLAHEIRTPLSVLQSTIEAMMDGILEPSYERLQSCQEEIIRLERMMKKLEYLNEIDEEPIQCKKTKINEIVQSTLMAFQGEATLKHIELRSDLEEVEAMVNPDQIKQVLVNLISNALKYSDASTTINVTLKRQAKTYTIQVRDQGIGISEKDLPHIFEYLYRSDDSRTKATGGHGIGLTLVQSIVEAHQGSIEVTSTLHQGTCFIITLPVNT